MSKNYKAALFDAYGVCVEIQKYPTNEQRKNIHLIATILELKKHNVQAYLATNCDVDSAKYLFHELFSDVFIDVFSSGAIGTMKPSAEFFQYALDELTTRGITKEEIVFFDDSQSNVQGAKDFGIDAHLYKDVHQVREIFSLPPLPQKS